MPKKSVNIVTGAFRGTSGQPGYHSQTANWYLSTNRLIRRLLIWHFYQTCDTMAVSISYGIIRIDRKGIIIIIIIIVFKRYAVRILADTPDILILGSVPRLSSKFSKVPWSTRRLKPSGDKGERRNSSYSFLTSALDVVWSASRPGRALPPGKDLAGLTG
jgi:hypothetical protein